MNNRLTNSGNAQIPPIQQNSLHHTSRSSAWYENECRNLLKDSLRSVGDANMYADQAAQSLNTQTEQIQRISSDADAVSENLDTSQYLIKGMKSWWGSVVQLFTAPPLPTSKSQTLSSENLSPCPLEAPQLSSPPSFQSTSVLHKSPQNFPVNAVDQDLNQLSDLLSGLHEKASRMGDAISHQNIELDSIQSKIHDNTIRMNKQKQDMEKLLKKK